MTETPRPPLGAVRLRTVRLRHDLTAEARRRTAEVGLSGFTIDELCTAVGVSRRTFFNHFATKDDVVVGRAVDDDDAVLDAWAAARPPAGAPPLSTALQDLADLAVDHLAQIGLTRSQAVDFRAALDREPRLLGEVMRAGEAQRHRFVVALARREGLDPADPRLDTVVTLGAALITRAVEQFLADEPPPTDASDPADTGDPAGATDPTRATGAADPTRASGAPDPTFAAILARHLAVVPQLSSPAPRTDRPEGADQQP
ncbi:TetR/AcrR family transcriptional regulator [Frigoribacterium salinisoli]